MANRVSSNQTIEIPGISIQMRQRICTQADKQHPMTLGSSVMLFKDDDLNALAKSIVDQATGETNQRALSDFIA
jgi:hypothetical protein